MSNIARLVVDYALEDNFYPFRRIVLGEEPKKVEVSMLAQDYFRMASDVHSDDELKVNLGLEYYWLNLKTEDE